MTQTPNATTITIAVIKEAIIRCLVCIAILYLINELS